MFKSGTNIETITFREVVRPLRVVFSTAQGQKAVMRSIIVRVSLADGSTGSGECPTSLSLSNETIPVIEGVLREVLPVFHGLPVEEWESVIAHLRRRYHDYPMTISGLEVALFRAHLKSRGITEPAYWGGNTRTVETDITIPFTLNRTFLARWLKYGVTKGFTTYKLKVSGNVEQDEEVIAFTHTMLKNNLERFALRLDGNQGYSTRTFQQILDYVQKQGLDIELFEQPLPKDDWQGFAEINRCSPIPIILDETVLTAADAQRIGEEHLAHGINIKIAKSGIKESAAILAVAKRHGLKLMVGCMTETMVGLSAAVNLAAGTGAFDYIDLDAVFLLHHKNRYSEIALKGPSFVLNT